ncbi:MAG: hypothetical protein IJW19_01040 [Clostridia bacterium]|nr:hypothetical protein [Clostridia bacterium]
MKSLIKKNLQVIIPTLCLILCICIALPMGIYQVEGREIAHDYSVTVSGNSVYPVGYEKNGNILTPVEEDAYLVLPVPRDREINDVRIIFKDTFDEDCDIKLAYGSKNSGLSSNEPITKTMKKGYDEYYCTLDTDEYTVMECYIPAEIEIEAVILSHVTSSVPITEIRVNAPVLLWILIPAFSLYILWIASLFFRRKKHK